jgi:HK97 gp10 family phage protein
MPKVYRVDKLEVPELDTVTAKIRRKVMRPAVKLVAEKVREIAPDSGRAHKGKLKKSIRYQVLDRGNKGEVKSTSPVAHLVHDGTAAHQITPSNAPALMFAGRTGLVHAKAVNHPGSRAQPFLLEAEAATRPDVERVLKQGAEAALAEIAAGVKG